MDRTDRLISVVYAESCVCRCLQLAVCLSVRLRRSTDVMIGGLRVVVCGYGEVSSLFSRHIRKLECGPMPNGMAALPNVGGALFSTPQSLADAQTRVPCSNAAKTRNPLKLAGVPQTNEPISASSRPKFAIL